MVCRHFCRHTMKKIYNHSRKSLRAIHSDLRSSPLLFQLIKVIFHSVIPVQLYDSISVLPILPWKVFLPIITIPALRISLIIRLTGTPAPGHPESVKKRRNRARIFSSRSALPPRLLPPGEIPPDRHAAAGRTAQSFP